MNFARVALGEISFEAVGFAVGQGGYDYITPNPINVLPIDTTSQALTFQIFPAVTVVVSATGNITNGSNQLTNVIPSSGIAEGQLITGAGIPANTVVSSVNGSTVTMNQDATATTTAVSVTFSTDIQPLADIEYPTPQTCVINSRLAPNDALAGLGELGVWAQIIHSTNPSEIGTQFLMAVAHLPLQSKTTKEVIVYRMVIQF
jgi:hypothetical protein